MNAYTLAAQLLGDTELSAGQLAQLRTIDAGHQQRLFTLLHDGGAARPARAPTAQELAALRETIVRDLLEMLTPEQRAALSGR